MWMRESLAEKETGVNVRYDGMKQGRGGKGGKGERKRKRREA